MSKERLDVYLLNTSLAPSRSKAAQLINNGSIFVNGKMINKPSFLVDENDDIKIIENDILKYVSRGGLKLEKALNVFDIDVKGLTILDIGSSTGGFTDCLLQNNAKKVYALDVGSDQLSPTLKQDERVVSLENTNFKDVNKEMFDDDIDMYVCDVSFISITTILKKLREFDDKFTIIILYKPQFEVGKANLNAKGVVKNSKCLVEALNNFKMFLDSLNIGILNYSFSPIMGNKEGNVEYLFYLKHNEKSVNVNFNELVKKSYEVLKVK